MQIYNKVIISLFNMFLHKWTNGMIRLRKGDPLLISFFCVIDWQYFRFNAIHGQLCLQFLTELRDVLGLMINRDFYAFLFSNWFIRFVIMCKIKKCFLFTFLHFFFKYI